MWGTELEFAAWLWSIVINGCALEIDTCNKRSVGAKYIDLYCLQDKTGCLTTLMLLYRTVKSMSMFCFYLVHLNHGY